MKPIPTSYSINMAACREANDMLTKENAELRAENARLVLVERLIERVKKLTKDRSEIRTATIERCAQVAEENDRTFGKRAGKAIAAAIRALKEEGLQPDELDKNRP